MGILFSSTDGPKMSAPPRVITIYDDLGGCPPARSNPILSVSMTVANPSYFWVTGGIIRSYGGRTDIQVYIQGPAGSNYASSTKLTNRLNWTSNTTWEHVVFDATAYGNVPGTYTLSVSADSPTSWGCGRTHGKISLLGLEVS